MPCARGRKQSPSNLWAFTVYSLSPGILRRAAQRTAPRPRERVPFWSPKETLTKRFDMRNLMSPMRLPRVAFLLMMLLRDAAGYCLGTAGETKSCRPVRTKYVAAAVPASMQGADNMNDIDTFLMPRGLPGKLPLLRVEYDDGRVSLRGGGSQLNNSAAAFLGVVPAVTWDASDLGTATVVMVDFDCGGRQSDGSLAGSCGPVLHGMWSDCADGRLSSCRKTIIPYLAPGVDKNTNRYVWLLFKQPAPLAPSSLAARGRKSVAYWDLVGFLKLNPSLALKAYNFAHVTGYGKPASNRKRTRGRVKMKGKGR